jgi:hypothetical protein
VEIVGSVSEILVAKGISFVTYSMIFQQLPISHPKVHLRFNCGVTGMPHLHIIIDRYIEQSWLKRAWMEAGGGEHVDIRGVSMRAVSHYLKKYLTKELLCSAPKRSRGVTVSRALR